ncbi:MAG: DUF1579 family protein [Verrucomicrobiales bacterium]|nr:DUF1579 family protein [Verrucomicrobiales bacterium]
MKPIVAIFSIVLAVVGSTLHAADAPKQPSPEMRKLEMFIGKWKYEETEVATPFGPGGKSTYRATDRFVHDDYFVEERATGHSPSGPVSWTWFGWYDQESGVFRSTNFESGGRVVAGTFSIDGDSMIGFGERKLGDRTYKTKSVYRWSPDRKSATYETSYSEDGVTWKLWYTGKATRTGR